MLNGAGYRVRIVVRYILRLEKYKKKLMILFYLNSGAVIVIGTYCPAPSA